jgi:chaperonin GroEL (HSP60 family)
MPWRKWGPKGPPSRRSKATDTTLEVVEGLRFDRGYLSFAVNDTAKMQVILDDPSIFLYGESPR